MLHKCKLLFYYEQKMIVYATEAQLETSRNEVEIHDPNFSFQKRFYQLSYRIAR